MHFARAETQFTEAIRIARQPDGGALRDSLLRVATGGRASVRAWQGKWAEAAADAASVPISLRVRRALLDEHAAREQRPRVRDHNALEYTVFNTQWAQVFRDPRVPWDTVKTTWGAVPVGQDGRTTFFRQRKYNGLGADIPLVKGTEMLILRAEAALRGRRCLAAMALINQARAFYSTTAAPLPPLRRRPSAAGVADTPEGARRRRVAGVAAVLGSAAVGSRAAADPAHVSRDARQVHSDQRERAAVEP